MKRTRLSALASVLALVGLMLIGLGLRKSVTINLDGEATQLVTSAWTVNSLLEEAGIQVRENDAITPDLESWLWRGEVVSIHRASWVTLHADGEIIRLHTLERLPSKLLDDAGLELLPEDQLIADGQLVEQDDPLSPGKNHSLQIQRAQTVELAMGEEVIRFRSTAPSLGEALWENEIELRAGDKLEPPAETPLDKPLKAQLKESQPLHIQFAGGKLESRSAADSVAEALSEVGVPLQGLDYSVPETNSPLPQDGVIKVVRVREELLLESEPISYETETQPAPNVEIDSRKMVQSGVLGFNTKRLRVRYEDEIEISRSAEGEYISLEPQPEIIGYGTKIVPNTLDTPGGTITYWRALNMYAISYKPSSAGDDVTATGLRLEKGIVAIDPTIIPYGTEMYVPGYGHALAADTGGGVKGRMIDLGYSDDDYVSWHEWVTVYFLWPPPENVVWIIP